VTTLLQTIDLQKRFGETRACDGLNFVVRQGEFLSLVGSTGAGKTSLVNLISAHLRPDSGKMERSAVAQSRLVSGRTRDRVEQEHVNADYARLTAADFTDYPERINLERDFVTSLTAGCHAIVAGYTLKREYFNTEFSDGIEISATIRLPAWTRQCLSVPQN
jgi:ABC-type Na+ transport system ATPase subunit NatA